MCNVVFATIVRNMDAGQREEFVEELNAPDDPWAQAEKVWAQLPAGYGR